MKKRSSSIIPALFAVLLFTNALFGQSTGFSYQGSINVAGTPANGNYDFEFVLYDALNGGNQIGSVQSRNSVAVQNGIFSVRLDFGSSFPGAGRFLEIRVRPTGQPGMTILTPRQPIDSAPYSIKSLNADSASNALGLGGLPANQFVLQTDGRLTDARPPTAGSANYVQNTANQQAASNFNISGNGTAGGTLSANVVNTATNYRIGGATVLNIAGTANTFVGDGAGTANLATFNTFVGRSAGAANTSGGSNSFFGAQAGLNTTTGVANSFFGSSAGSQNTTGENNAFFGSGAGSQGNTGSNNSFFGWRAGRLNSGSSNAFFGAGTGDSNTTGVNNAFFGANAGAANTTALGNSFFGANAGAANVTAMGNSFFGASAGLVNTGANNSFFGTVAGVANTTGFNNAFFGYWAGHDNSNGDNNAFFGRSAGELNTTGNGNTFVGANAGDANTTGSNNTTLGNGADVNSFEPVSYGTAIGAGAVVTTSNRIVLGRSNGNDQVYIPGALILATFGAGNDAMCANFTGTIGLCVSSLRYKKAVENLTDGLSVVRRLRPISFTWKEDGMADLGFAAEEVDEIEPRLVMRRNGRIEGVRYGHITTVLVNAVKEQQAEIEDLRLQISELKALVCAQNPTANLCDKRPEPRSEGKN